MAFDPSVVEGAIAANANSQQFNVAATPFHQHNASDSSSLDFTNLTGRTRFIVYRLLAPTDAVSVANVVGGYFVMPFSGYVGVANITGGNINFIEGVPTSTIIGYAAVDTAGTTGTTIIVPKISRADSATRTAMVVGNFAFGVTSGHQSSLTTTQQPTFDFGTGQAALSIGDRISFDVTAVSSSAPLGLSVCLRITETSQ